MTQHHTTTDTFDTTTTTFDTTTRPSRRDRRHAEAGSARTKVLAGVALVGVLGAVGAFVVLGGGSDASDRNPGGRHPQSDRAAAAVAVAPAPAAAPEASTPVAPTGAGTPTAGTGHTEAAPATVPAPGTDAAPAAPATPAAEPATGSGGYTIERVCCLAPETPGVITTIPPATGLPQLTLPPGVLLPLLPGAGMLPTPSVTLPPLGR